MQRTSLLQPVPATVRQRSDNQMIAARSSESIGSAGAAPRRIAPQAVLLPGDHTAASGSGSGRSQAVACTQEPAADGQPGYLAAVPYALFGPQAAAQAANAAAVKQP